MRKQTSKQPIRGIETIYPISQLMRKQTNKQPIRGIE